MLLFLVSNKYYFIDIICYVAVSCVQYSMSVVVLVVFAGSTTVTD